MRNVTEAPQSPAPAPGAFATTHWSVVARAGLADSPEAGQALETLCRTYWYPIYVFVRREGYSPQDAEDLTQEFFARLLRLKSLASVAPHKGKFRTFLLASLKHLLADARDKARAAKRGAGQIVLSLDDQDAEHRYQLEPATDASPELLFDRRWVIAVLEQALARLGQEYADAGKAAQFEGLKEFLQSPTEDGDYDRVAAALGLNPGAVAVAVHRLRQRYGDLVRAEIAQTVSGPEEMEEELRHLFGR